MVFKMKTKRVSFQMLAHTQNSLSVYEIQSLLNVVPTEPVAREYEQVGTLATLNFSL